MAKKPSKRKAPIRHFDPRRVRKGFVYTAKDIAAVYGVDESSVHRWAREEGLIPIDDKTPAMFHHETTRQFLEYKNQSRKMETGNAGDLPCFKCHLKRRAYQDKITVKSINDKVWAVQGLCSCCGSEMNQRTQANEFLLTITWGYTLVGTLPKWSIKGSNNTSVITTGKGNKTKGKFKPKGERKFCPDNERIKHLYFNRRCRKFDKKTLYKIVAALMVFEEFSGFKDFKSFCYNDVKGFQKYVLDKYGHSMQTANRTMVYVREFFFWLREHNGYKRVKYDDVDDLQLSLKDQERAKATKPKNYLDASKWQDLILNLTPETDIEHRGQAMLATLLLTGARIDALISFNIGDFNLERSYAFQDAEHVNSKRASSWKTNLWKFKPELRQILDNWIIKLKNEHGFTDGDPLFPKVDIAKNELSLFQNGGFLKEPIKTQGILRGELYKQLEKAGFGHYTPHTVRNSLVNLFFSLPLTLEQQKAVSQNMSHKNLGTTINGYGQVSEYRQDAIIDELDVEHLLKVQKLHKNPKYQYIMSQMDTEEAVNKVFEVITKA